MRAVVVRRRILGREGRRPRDQQRGQQQAQGPLPGGIPRKRACVSSGCIHELGEMPESTVVPRRTVAVVSGSAVMTTRNLLRATWPRVTVPLVTVPSRSHSRRSDDAAHAT